jgi:hypothetical protein
LAGHAVKKLDLTHEQREELKEVDKGFKTSLQELDALTKQEKKEKLEALQASHSEEIKAIFTEEQKLEDLKKNHASRKVN